VPIYIYECPNHGRQDVFTRSFDILKVRPCQKCGKSSKICVTAPSRHNIERDWNEKANEYRRDPYTQAKAQLTNFHRGELEYTERDCDRPENPVTEEAIQIGAREIDKQNKNPQPDMEDRYVADVRRKSKAARKKAAKEV
jgi:hypothetical protein